MQSVYLLMTFAAALATIGCGSSVPSGPPDASNSVSDASNGLSESSTSDSSGPSSGSDSGAIDGSTESGDDGAPTCVPQNGVYNCLGGSWPACIVSASGSQSCPPAAASCMYCSQGAGFACACDIDSGSSDSGVPTGQCIGTEHTCQ